MSIKQTYKALGDKDYSIALFADAFRSGETTITELYAYERPSNNGQALALFGGYAHAHFGMTLSAISDNADILTTLSVAQDIYQLMIDSADLASLVRGLDSLLIQVEDKAAERRALNLANGTTHKTSIKAILNQVDTLRQGVVTGENLAHLEEAITMLQGIYTESRNDTLVSA